MCLDRWELDLRRALATYCISTSNSSQLTRETICPHEGPAAMSGLAPDVAPASARASRLTSPSPDPFRLAGRAETIC